MKDTFPVLSHLIQYALKFYGIDFIFSILQIEKLRPREIKKLAWALDGCSVVRAKRGRERG